MPRRPAEHSYGPWRGSGGAFSRNITIKVQLEIMWVQEPQFHDQTNTLAEL